VSVVSPAPMAPTRSAYGIRTLRELEMESESDGSPYVVEGLIPTKSVNIAVGDSGLGKSPWAYQLALCVAGGVPFLGHAVSQGRVLYIDLENGTNGIVDLSRSLVQHLHLSSSPDDFRLITSGEYLHRLGDLLKECKPTLVTIDSLRAYQPDAEDRPRNAAAMMNELKKLARQHGAAFLLIHHIRKPGEDGAPSLENERVMTWLNMACGARALINQSDVRMAFDISAGARRVAAERSKNGAGEEVGLVVKGFARLRGEFGPLFLTRDCNEEGEPLGYRRMTGVELLFNIDQQAMFAKLPQEFQFKEAKRIYGRQDQATRDFLQKCERVGVLKRCGHGRYVKVAE
jgi:hypothetical protein